MSTTWHTTKRLYRCREDRQIAGVAGGIAEYLEIDPTVVRILWILAFLAGGFGLLLYIIMAFVVPLEPLGYDTPAGFRTGGTAAGTDAGAAGEAEGQPFVSNDTAAGSADPTAAGPTQETVEATATAPAGPVPVHGHGWAHAPANAAWHGERRVKRERGGGATMAFGVLLVVFGLIALLGPVFPGWLAGASLGPAFLVALGVALLAGALRRPAGDR